MDAREILTQSLIKEGSLKTPRIIDAFRAIDRADFVLPEYKDEAYQNYPLPLGEGQTISQPLTVGFMLELLDPEPGEKILDIGSGSGWTTALLAYIVGENGKIFGIERIPQICKFGQKNLAKYFKEDRAKTFCRDGTEGLPEQAPFDKILAGATASHEIPTSWRDQLKIHGKIVAPVEGSIWVFIKKSETEWEEKEYPGFIFVPLIRESRIKNQELGEKKDIPKRKFNLFLASCFLLLASVALIANEIYRPHISFKGAKSVEIAPGLGSRKIGELLKKEGVIRSKWALVTYVSLKRVASNLKPGDYAFGRETIPEITRDLLRGGTNERVITIPEGWSTKDISEYLKEEGFVADEKVEKLISIQGAKVFAERFDFLKDKPANLGLEGYLFPDTYRIFKDAKPEDILGKMLENFGKKLTPDLRQEITRQNKTVFQIVTMASLIEKEVATDEDRAVVSGILWKRLNTGIGLQVDATIAYITGKNTTKILREDLQIDSPYNTYKYRGLPKGPIANPGLSAIRAAIYPKESPYLYYLSTPEGQTIFSKTLDEHNEAKAKYLH